MKLLTWNLNGLLSCVEHGSFDAIQSLDADVVCCQEIRTMQQSTVLPSYCHFWNASKRDGYSGTLTMSKQKPLSVSYGLGDEHLDFEGRVVTAEYESFCLVNVYAPNSQKNLKRRQFRMDWDAAFYEYLINLNEEKPAIACGDFNVARLDIDIYPENMRQYWARQGYLSDEASNLETLLENGYCDAYRCLHPTETGGAYTWWSNRLNRRAENRGWRLDYFLVPEILKPKLVEVRPLQDVLGSDHCPLVMEISL